MKQPNAPEAMTGVQRAAVLLLSLGEGEAAEVLRHMGAKEVQKLGLAMATMNGVTREQVLRVMDEFEGALDRQTSLGVGADDYIRNMLIQALGADKAGSLIDREEARRTALAAQSALINVQRERVAAWITLYRALGGGWAAADATPDTPSNTPSSRTTPR